MENKQYQIQDILELDETGKVKHFDDMLFDLKKFTERVFKTAQDNGHYSTNPETAPLLFHIVAETSEASEAMLTRRFAHEPLLDMLSDGFHTDTFEKTIKNTAGDELADIIILAMSIAKYKNIPIEKHLIMKMLYNEHRTEHSATTQSYTK